MDEGMKSEEHKDPLDEITDPATKDAVKSLRAELADVHGVTFPPDEAVVHLKRLGECIGKILFESVNPEAEASVGRIKSSALREIAKLTRSL